VQEQQIYGLYLSWLGNVMKKRQLTGLPGASVPTVLLLLRRLLGWLENAAVVTGQDRVR